MIGTIYLLSQYWRYPNDVAGPYFELSSRRRYQRSRYIFRSALPLKRLTYVEGTGHVYYQDSQGPGSPVGSAAGDCRW
jgi:hypothetical protein